LPLSRHFSNHRANGARIDIEQLGQWFRTGTVWKLLNDPRARLLSLSSQFPPVNLAFTFHVIDSHSDGFVHEMVRL
jgi:hypothetical protein